MTIKYLRSQRRQYPSWIQPIRLGSLLGCWIVLGAASSGGAQDWTPQARETLEKPIAIFWNAVPLRDALTNLSATQGVPVFLDRRIDPGQPISIETKDTSVGEVLYRLADQAGCGVAWMGDLAYLGPPSEVSNLHLLREQLLANCRRLPRGLNRLWLKSSEFEIPELSQPNELLKLTLSDLEVPQVSVALPHDLWAGSQYDSIRPIDQLILLTFGFELWPDFGASGKLTIAATPSPQQGKIKIRISKTERDQIRKLVDSKYPTVQLESSGRYLTMKGPPRAIHDLRSEFLRSRWQVKAATTSPLGGQKVVSGRIKGSIGQALNTAAKGLSLQLSFEPALRPRLLTQIDITVQGVTYRELADRVLVGTGLSVSVRDGKLEVFER